MLEYVKKPGRAKSVYQIVGYSMLALICLSFAFIGLSRNDQSAAENGGVAAIVNSEVIPLRDFQRAYETEQKQLGDGFNQLPAAQRRMFEQRIRQRTMENLVATEVLYQSAAPAGFVAPDKAVLDQVVTLPYFQEDGRFSREIYLKLLQANGMTPRDFEGQIRRQVALNEVRDAFSRSLKRPSLMQSLEAEAKATKINLEFVQFERNNLDVTGTITDAKVKEYLATPEGQTAVESHYNTNKPTYEIAKEVHARHILIKTNQGRTDADALTKIKELKAQAKLENFAELAKANSEDEGSKEKGGDLGFFSKGRMVPEFENVAMGLAPNTISEPVKTPYGYHLIMVEEVRGGGTKPLDQVRTEIAREMMSGKVRDEALVSLEKAVAGDGNLNALVAQYKLKWETTGDFNLSESNIPKLGAVNEAAVEAVKLHEAGKVVPKLVRGEGKINIIKVKSFARVPVATKAAPDEFSMAPMQALEGWAKTLQSNAKIKRNTSLLDI